MLVAILRWLIRELGEAVLYWSVAQLLQYLEGSAGQHLEQQMEEESYFWDDDNELRKLCH